VNDNLPVITTTQFRELVDLINAPPDDKNLKDYKFDTSTYIVMDMDSGRGRDE